MSSQKKLFGQNGDSNKKRKVFEKEDESEETVKPKKNVVVSSKSNGTAKHQNGHHNGKSNGSGKAKTFAKEDASSEDEDDQAIKKPITKKAKTSVAEVQKKKDVKVDSDEEEEEEEFSTKKDKKVTSAQPTKDKQSKVKASKPIKKKEDDDGEEEEEEEKKTLSAKKSDTLGTKPKSVSTASLTSSEFQKEHEITVKGKNASSFEPIQTFEDASRLFPSHIMAATKKFTKPTPIQAQCWPILLKKRDIIAIAETGSGKTLAFGLPGLVHLEELKSKKGKYDEKKPSILVLSPTRELAMQTAVVFEESGHHGKFKSVCVYGGVPKSAQIGIIKKGVHVVIATPGRLIDLMGDGSVDLSQITLLVLDEADRMLDMGFEPAIRQIVAEVPSERLTWMFSATWPQSIQSLANEFLNDPVQVSIGSLDLSANHRVAQIVEVVEPYDKDSKLLDILSKYHKSRKNKVLVFALYKMEASRIESFLQSKGWKCIAIHGDKSQALRTDALEKFKSGRVPLLIATDVAARGLDIPDVEYVINYTFPLTIEDYVHRIGRTGRGGKTGTSHTFFTFQDKSHAGELTNVLREANQKVPEDLTKFGTAIKKKEHALYGNHFKDLDTNAKSKHIKF
eukprot:TRINITY_DN1753_c0_g1_i3.p1 TRINITY_DN1753_c0_g1~~TRINITY_DN1753_c0_g1_i3.p1  ORF type:complete len:621 (-),score=257.72 TRINITY_DN1753_c0_g1_i3:46-1908(-)